MLIVYEYVLTFDKELRVIWGRRFTIPTILFLANRYLAFVFVLSICMSTLFPWAENNTEVRSSTASHVSGYCRTEGFTLGVSTIVCAEYVMYTHQSYCACISCNFVFTLNDVSIILLDLCSLCEPFSLSISALASHNTSAWQLSLLSESTLSTMESGSGQYSYLFSDPTQCRSIWSVSFPDTYSLVPHF